MAEQRGAGCIFLKGGMHPKPRQLLFSHARNFEKRWGGLDTIKKSDCEDRLHSKQGRPFFDRKAETSKKHSYMKKEETLIFSVPDCSLCAFCIGRQCAKGITPPNKVCRKVFKSRFSMKG